MYAGRVRRVADDAKYGTPSQLTLAETVLIDEGLVNIGTTQQGTPYR